MGFPGPFSLILPFRSDIMLKYSIEISLAAKKWKIPPKCVIVTQAQTDFVLMELKSEKHIVGARDPSRIALFYIIA